MTASVSMRLAAVALRAGTTWLTDALMSGPEYTPGWPASAPRGRKIIKRQFDFCGQKIEMAGPIRWRVEEAELHWHRTFFSFGWLQDIAAIQSDKIASSFAREFINGFTLLRRQDDIHSCAWESEVAGERLSNWLYYRHFVLKGGSRAFFVRYQRSLIRHVRFLYQQGALEPGGLGPHALKGLIAAGVFIAPLRFIVPICLPWLEQLLDRDILADGGHISHSPAHHITFLTTLIEMRDLLELAHLTYDPLNEAITRMGVLLQTLCHGDGRMGVFQDNLMGDAEMIAQTVARAGGPFEPLRHAPQSGYARLDAPDSCVLLRMSPSEGRHPPLGIAALEFSSGSERVLVNCGSYIGPSAGWREALQQTGAFSTCESHPDGPAFPVTQEVNETETMQTAMIRYLIGDYVRHERNLELSADGQSLTGKDIFDVRDDASAEDLPEITARFHLHPDIRCTRQSDGELTLTSLSGAKWQFICSLPKGLSIQESVYLGYDGKPQRTQQIVIPVPQEPEGTGMRWELQKVS